MATKKRNLLASMARAKESGSPIMRAARGVAGKVSTAQNGGGSGQGDPVIYSTEEQLAYLKGVLNGIRDSMGMAEDDYDDEYDGSY